MCPPPCLPFWLNTMFVTITHLNASHWAPPGSTEGQRTKFPRPTWISERTKICRPQWCLAVFRTHGTNFHSHFLSSQSLEYCRWKIQNGHRVPEAWRDSGKGDTHLWTSRESTALDCGAEFMSKLSPRMVREKKSIYFQVICYNIWELTHMTMALELDETLMVKS